MNVFYFGGYRATHEDVMSWKKSLERRVHGIKAIVFAYPDGASAGDPLDRWSTERSEELAQQVSGGDKIVGHSSGCAIANDVAYHALALKKQFGLIALDGFRPKDILLKLPKTAVWSARCGDICSLNYNALSGSENFHVYEAKVTKRWPLHFSLVNINVSDDYAGIEDGYRHCDVNLEVLGLEADASSVT